MSQVNYANRGMGLEVLVEASNAQYAFQDIATIQKVPTSVKVTRIDKGRIKDGFFEKDSTVDFVGVFRGIAIAFDAKSTKEKTSYPLANIEDHQINFLNCWEKTGGKSFYLFELTEFREIYFVRSSWVKTWWDEMKLGGRKSIPIAEIRKLTVCEIGKRSIVLDYLSHLTEVTG